MSTNEKDCAHEMFQANVKVTRLTEDEKSDVVTGYTTDITVHCAQCGQAFEWLGVHAGLAPDRPMVSFSGLELRAPIRPSKAPIEKDPKKTYN